MQEGKHWIKIVHAMIAYTDESILSMIVVS